MEAAEAVEARKVEPATEIAPRVVVAAAAESRGPRSLRSLQASPFPSISELGVLEVRPAQAAAEPVATVSKGRPLPSEPFPQIP